MAPAPRPAGVEAAAAEAVKTVGAITAAAPSLAAGRCWAARSGTRSELLASVRWRSAFDAVRRSEAKSREVGYQVDRGDWGRRAQMGESLGGD